MRRRNIFEVSSLKLLLFCSVFLSNSVFVLAQPTTEQRLDGFLKALGGRGAWASIKGVRLTVIHRTTAVRLPFQNTILNDFETPRFRIEASNSEYYRLLMWQKKGERWLKRDKEKPVALSETEDLNHARWWESNPYRIIHGLAKGDSEMSAKVIEPDRLAVFRSDGVRLCWFRLNQLNEPIAFGTWDAEDGTVFGPLTEANFGIRHPKWTARPDGRWQAEAVKFEFVKTAMNFASN